MDEKKKEEIKAGDNVVLRGSSHSVLMTAAESVMDGSRMHCMWFDLNGNLMERVIPIAALQLHPECHGCGDDPADVTEFQAVRDALKVIPEANLFAYSKAFADIAAIKDEVAVFDMRFDTETITGLDGVNSPGDTIATFCVLIPKRTTPPA